MKKLYPKYKQGEVQEIKKKLNLKSKKILGDFLKLCSLKAGIKKVEKIERMMLQFYDVTEISFDKIKKDILIDYLIILNEADRSSETRNEIKIYLRKFIKWYYKDLEMIELFSVAEKDKGQINDEKINEKALITEEEFERMLRSAESFREKALLTLLWETGARPQEIVNLKWKHIGLK